MRDTFPAPLGQDLQIRKLVVFVQIELPDFLIIFHIDEAYLIQPCLHWNLRCSAVSAYCLMNSSICSMISATVSASLVLRCMTGRKYFSRSTSSRLASLAGLWAGPSTSTPRCHSPR